MKFFAAIGKRRNPCAARAGRVCGQPDDRGSVPWRGGRSRRCRHHRPGSKNLDAGDLPGPGLRWAFMGPHLLYHLGGWGRVGIGIISKRVGPSREAGDWPRCGTSPLTPALREQLIAGVEGPELRALRSGISRRGAASPGLRRPVRLRAAMGDKPSSASSAGTGRNAA